MTPGFLLKNTQAIALQKTVTDQYTRVRVVGFCL